MYESVQAMGGSCSFELSAMSPIWPAGTFLRELCGGSQCHQDCLQVGVGSNSARLRRLPLEVSTNNETNVSQSASIQPLSSLQNQTAEGYKRQEDDNTGSFPNTETMSIAATVMILLVIVGIMVFCYVARHMKVSDHDSEPDKSKSVSEGHVAVEPTQVEIEVDVEAGSRA
jgi:hypothetical protein